MRSSAVYLVQTVFRLAARLQPSSRVKLRAACVTALNAPSLPRLRRDFLATAHKQSVLRDFIRGARVVRYARAGMVGTRSRRIAPGQTASTVQRAALVQQLIVRFITQLLGAAVYLSFTRNLQRRLTVNELVYIALQGQRIFMKMPASQYQIRRLEQYPWRYGAMALYLAVALREPSLLVMWLQTRLRVMTLHQHRRFLRTLALTLRTAVVAPTARYQLLGLRLYVAGKISVTGNAMSRVYRLSAGCQGNASLALRHTQAFTLLRTKTGCLGFTLGFYF